MRLAQRYLDNIRQEVDEVGFDAEDLDRDHIAQRLKEDVDEAKGRQYRLIATSLDFANASYIEDHIYELLEKKPTVKHVILMCTAVNEIDLSALEVLESINQRLEEASILLHLSEVKGPVMDLLDKTHFITDLSGKVWLSQHRAEQDILQEFDR